MNLHSSLKICFMLCLALAWGCQDSDFSGDSAKRGSSNDPSSEDGTAKNDGDHKNNADYDADGNKLGEDGDGLGNNQGLGEGGDSGSGQPMIDRFVVGEAPKKVDVVFFFDQSGSMKKFVDQVSARLSDFIKNFMQSKKNLDYRLLIVAREFSMPVTSARVGMTKIGIGNHNSLNVAQDLFTGKASTGNIKLRARSNKEIIVVSNDNSAIGSDEFAQWVKDNRMKVGRVKVNGFVGFKETGPLGYLGDCYVDKKGGHYLDMAKNPSIGGLIQDICSPDWDGLMNNLGKKITDVPLNLFDLSQLPADPDEVEVLLNGDPLAASDYKVGEDGSLEILAPVKSGDGVTIKYISK